MKNQKVYKITESQLKVIVESQQGSPQLQTEIFDRSAEILGKGLKNLFTNSVKLFKYVQGIKVEIHNTNKGKSTPFKYKKKNPLAPLGLGDATTSTPKINGVIPNVSGIDDELFSNGTMIYPVKFKFLNLAENKQNQPLQYATWNIEVSVEVDGNDLTLVLDSFTSGQPRRTQRIKKTNDVEYTEEIPVDYAALSVVFIGQNQANKFMDIIKKQFLDSILKPFIAQYNKNTGEKITIPNIRTKVNPDFITTEIAKNTKLSDTEVDEIKAAMLELKNQYNKYKNVKGSEEYVNTIQKTYVRLQNKIK